MNYIKAKYLKNGAPTGRTYTFRTEENVVAGNILVTADGKHIVMVDETVDMEWVETYGREKIAVVTKVEPVKVESEE